MRSLSLKLVPLMLFGLVLAACDSTFSGLEQDAIDPSVPSFSMHEVCTTVTFDGFDHGDAVTSMTVQGVPLTLSAVRYPSDDAVDPTAYDVELTGADLAALNNTHDDTQAERDCTDCAGLGRILLVPDENFAVGGDNTEGGEIAITGFGADAEATWSIDAFDVVDGDAAQGFTTLYVDAVENASNTRTGNGTVETVTADPNTITSSISFVIGSDADASGGIDNLVLCRAEEQEDGEGCTPGYWKQSHHFDSWTGYVPGDDYDDVFGVGPEITLLAALESGGGGVNALLRHSVAALLSASSPDVDYGMTAAEVIAAVQDAFDTGDYESAKDVFEALNEQYCPLD